MKNYLNIILGILFIGLLGYYIFTRSAGSVEAPLELSNEEVLDLEKNSSLVADIEGCYVARNNKDVYTLRVEKQEGQNVTGSLDFNNYQKDSSQGSFQGTYHNGLLLGAYSFQSEGMDSEMQVAFKKGDEGFIRGYGELDEEGVNFIDPQALSFEKDALSFFHQEVCS